MEKFSVKKPVHHPCCGHHGPAAGLRVHHEPADEPSARHQHAIPHGGHRLPRCQPERVESEVSDVMENALGTVSGVESITATSAENYSLLLMKFAEAPT